MGENHTAHVRMIRNCRDPWLILFYFIFSQRNNSCPFLGLECLYAQGLGPLI
jgi:hypothetical protein